MVKWSYNPNEYEEKSFSIIPAGDHRVRISDVSERTFSSGNEGFEIVLEVSGHNGKLWSYLVLDPSDTKKTNQRLGGFFESFGITDYNLANFRAWIGKVGAGRVKHEEYMGQQQAKLAFFLSRSKQEALPEPKFATMAATHGVPVMAPEYSVSEDELPFA